MKYTRIILRRIFSSGNPCFSYMASRKQGSMTKIMQSAAALVLICYLSRKNSGTPISATALRANKLPFGQIQKDLAFYCRQVFRYGYISHIVLL